MVWGPALVFLERKKYEPDCDEAGDVEEIAEGSKPPSIAGLGPSDGGVGGSALLKSAEEDGDFDMI